MKASEFQIVRGLFYVSSCLSSCYLYLVCRLVVQIIQIVTGVTRLLLTTIFENTVAVVRTVAPLSHRTRQELRPIDSGISSRVHLAPFKESHETDLIFFVVTTLTIVSIVIFQVIKVVAGSPGFLWAAVGEYAVPVIGSVTPYGNGPWQETGLFHISIRTATDLAAFKERHKAYLWLAITAARAAIAKVVAAIAKVQVEANFRSLLET